MFSEYLHIQLQMDRRAEARERFSAVSRRREFRRRELRGVSRRLSGDSKHRLWC